MPRRPCPAHQRPGRVDYRRARRRGKAPRPVGNESVHRCPATAATNRHLLRERGNGAPAGAGSREQHRTRGLRGVGPGEREVMWRGLEDEAAAVKVDQARQRTIGTDGGIEQRRDGAAVCGRNLVPCDGDLFVRLLFSGQSTQDEHAESDRCLVEGRRNQAYRAKSG